MNLTVWHENGNGREELCFNSSIGNCTLAAYIIHWCNMIDKEFHWNIKLENGVVLYKRK